MRRLKNALNVTFLVILGLPLIFTSGCSHQKIRAPSASLDSADHHVYSGIQLLKKDLLDEAAREFNLALELESTYSPANFGLGLVQGHKGDFEHAFEYMSMAKKNSRSKHDKAMAYVGFMRLHTLQKGEKWLKKVCRNYHDALNSVEDMPEAHFYMGMAYKNAYRYDEANQEFTKVLSANRQLVGEADGQLRLVQKIERAMPGSEVGKKLALQEKITRADAAAIFVQELKLDKLYAVEKKSNMVLNLIPADIKDHPLRTDIESIIALRVRGLEVLPEGNFEPDSFITRAEYAMMIEDIIGVITHDSMMTVKNIGSASPFSDVDSNVPYFNAVIVCTTRGLLDPADIKTGAFQPMGSISGADALLVIRKLREELRIF